MKPNAIENGKSFSARGIVARVVLGLASWFVVVAVVLFNVIPQKHTLKAGDIAPEDFYATREVVDTKTTESNRQAAIAKVQDKYKQDDVITANVMEDLEACYTAIGKVRANGAAEIRKLDDNAASSAYKDTKGEIQFTAFFLEQCHTLLPGSFTDENVRHIILADAKTLEGLEAKVSELVKQALDNGIKEDYLSQSASSINQELISPIYGFTADAQRLGINLVKSFLKANFIYDAEGTQEAKDKAAADVQPAAYDTGERIAEGGTRVTEAQVQVLSDLGLLDDKNPHMLMYAGVGALTGLLILLLWLYLFYIEPEVFASFRRLLLLSIIFVMTVALLWLGKTFNGYLLLSTSGVMMIAVLVSYRPAFMVNALLSLLAGVLAGSAGAASFSSAALPAAVSALAGGTVALFLVRKTPHRSSLMMAGILSGIVSAAGIAAVDLILTLGWQNVLRDVGAGLAGGILSSFICLGMLPLWEVLFKVVTPMRLLELGNPNHPLLKRLLIEAPGTYHHSIVVGNLAESAAEAVGANALLTRTGAYYHDVGKLLRPYFFTENQLSGESPHDSIAPELSKRILTAHTKDGVELAAKYGLPQPIQDIVLEHHGTTPVMYFYHKAVKAASEAEPVSLDDYRYTGPKPHTREAAIIMMADSIEAGARSLKEHTQEKLDELVQHIVNMKLEDGQFDNCDLTLRDIGILSAEFRKVLGGIFHERVVYPTAELPKKETESEW